jgi:hypothetical protein
MSNDYLISVTARLEHEHRVRSMAPVPDFFDPMEANQSGWLLRPIKRLHNAMASGSASLRKWVKEHRALSMQRDLRGVKE